MADSSTSPPPPRVSRYRSQRKAQQASQQDDHVPALPQSPPHHAPSPAEDGVSRSKSRYRRPTTAAGAARPATASDQEQIDVPLRPRTSRHAAPKPLDLGSARPPQDPMSRHRSNRHPEPQREQVPSPTSPEHHTPKQPSVTDLFPPPKPEPVKPPTKTVQFDGPPNSDGIRATKSVTSLPHDEDPDKGGCFGLFKRKRGDLAPSGEKAPIARPVGDGEARGIKAGGGAAVPGIDAPVSAINTGDRTVLVECGRSKSLFPVTQSTTPVDIIKSAATCMDESISVKSAVLLEHFGTVGVQRPLRRYEHVRHVLNSWDTDRQNSLLLVDPRTGSSETELGVAGVPSHKPGEESWLLQISQKPGKWDRRLITLREDGQMTLQKDPKKPQDQLNICHLSDFDIYTPTPEKLKKKIKPPKKICYAIKSQQKTNMFQSMDNFVHFFCTGDRRTADSFYAAVQGWRSWYLVHVMGEGGNREAALQAMFVKDRELQAKAHKAATSPDSSYQLGSFKPLMDVAEVGRPASAEGPKRTSAGFTKSSSQFDTTISPERRASTAKRRHHPPGSMGNRGQLGEDEPLANLGRANSVDRRRPSLEKAKATPPEFVANGLLGRSYSQRRREYDEREQNKDSPFTETADLLTSSHDDSSRNRRSSLDGAPRRGYSTRRPEGTADLQRHASTRRKEEQRPSLDLQRTTSRGRDMPRPLIDLTPSYREPPQHVRRGKGYNPETIGPGGLIGSATSPDDPIGAPPSTDWRGRHQQQADSPQRSPSFPHTAALNGRSIHRSAGRSPHEVASSANAFTGEGLLAGSQGQGGWGGGDKGRGYMDGSRAKGPMLDLSEQSQFQQGSLLNKVEREKG